MDTMVVSYSRQGRVVFLAQPGQGSPTPEWSHLSHVHLEPIGILVAPVEIKGWVKSRLLG